MPAKQALKTTGLIILSLSVLLLIYFGVEAVTDYFDEGGYVALSILSNFSFAVIIYLLVRWFNKRFNGLTSSQYGFDARKSLVNFLLGVLAASFLVFTSLSFASFFTEGRVGFVALKDPVLLIELVMATLVVGAWEEFYFRGLVVNTLLCRKVNLVWTAVISSTLFTVLHLASFDLETITPYWMLGVFFISSLLLLQYIATGSIWMSVGCHFCWDLLFMSIDERENEFGVVEMKTYVRDEVLIDNIAIVVTGGVFIACYLLLRSKGKVWSQRYLSQLFVGRSF